MKKVHVFIDGSWLYKIAKRIREKQGTSLDYGRVKQIIANHLGVSTQEISQIHYFCSIRSTANGYNNKKQKDFYKILEENHGFTVHSFPAKFNTITKKWTEKKVDVALSSYMQNSSSGTCAFDIGVIVTGDSDFLPMLDMVKKRGKQLLLVAYNEVNYHPTSKELLDSHLFDFPTLYLDKYLKQLCYSRKNRA